MSAPSLTTNLNQKEIKMTTFIDDNGGVFVNDQLRKRPSIFNQFSQTLRINRSRHTGEWIVESLNTAYGYWATIRLNVPEDVADFLLNLPAYTGPLHEADATFRRCSTCG